MAEELDADKGFDLEAGPVKLRTKGYRMADIAVIIGLAMVAVIGFMIYEMRADTKTAAAALTSATSESAMKLATSAKSEHDKLGEAIQRGTEQQEIMNYILTLSPENREKLNMRMPDALRRKIVGRDP
jgi:CheY-specific phosphatase CheX